MWVLCVCGPACFIGLFHSLSLSPLCLCVSLPLSLIESRREFTGTAGRQGPCHRAEQHRNVLYALERQDSWGEIVQQVPKTSPPDVETRYNNKPAKGQSKLTITVYFFVTLRVALRVVFLML